MSQNTLPSVNLAAMPGRRNATLDLAREIEQRGFSGIYSVSLSDGLGLCQMLAIATERIALGTAISNIYLRHVSEYASTAAAIQEVSGGRFRFGVGVSHGPIHKAMGTKHGKPLADMRTFVEQLRAVPRVGELPPVIVAGMRKKMVHLAGEVGDGLIFANAARSHVPESLAALPQARQADANFVVANMVPTCISDDVAAAAAKLRRTLGFYLTLPNYRNYWKEAGYVEEMDAAEKAVATGDAKRIPSLISDRWLKDVTLYGPASAIREGIEAWREAGVNDLIIVPSSAQGNQMKAFEELFAALCD
jgi:alkanesulfonate monooxygenase SsuD/methylene tetrahydromethanopterin reductase-like flavin-dependent oxidoreductase (luciferase family)